MSKRKCEIDIKPWGYMKVLEQDVVLLREKIQAMQFVLDRAYEKIELYEKQLGITPRKTD